MKRFVGSALSTLLALVVLSSGMILAQAPSDGVTITSPREGDSVVNTNAQVSGTAPPSTIVTVVITDTDTNRSGVAHQEGGKVEGTVTAGSDGSWVYVPQHMLVPGQFSAQASYTNDQNQVVNSPAVRFVSLNASGSSTQLSSSLIRRLLIWGGLFVVAIVVITTTLITRKRRLDLKRIDANADEIEQELEHTAEALAATNAQIAELNKRLSDERKETLELKAHKGTT